MNRFQSTRPVRGGTLYRVQVGAFRDRISIHPPRAGRDSSVLLVTCANGLYFNPPAPCGAGLCGIKQGWGGEFISIHPPRAGQDKDIR